MHRDGEPLEIQSEVSSIVPCTNADNQRSSQDVENQKKPDPEELLTNTRISATSRILGVVWFALTYLFASEPPSLLVPILLFMGTCGWGVWETYWHKRWKFQEKSAIDLMNNFGDCLATKSLLKDLDLPLREDPNSLLQASFHKQATEVLKAIQILASDVAMYTTLTPLR
jgi:hypothetical protein